jgi:hypothetical protein
MDSAVFSMILTEMPRSKAYRSASKTPSRFHRGSSSSHENERIVKYNDVETSSLTVKTPAVGNCVQAANVIVFIEIARRIPRVRLPD